MNKGYTYIDGMVIISDGNGNHTQSEYYDNLEKVLVQKNVIEAMESRIQELIEESEIYPIIEKKFIPYKLYYILGTLLTAPPLTLWYITGTNPYIYNIDTTLGSVNLVLLLTASVSIMGLPLGTLFTVTDYLDYKERVKKGNGINSELEFLKLQLEKEKETLARLQEEKTRDKENTEFRSALVNDKEQLEKLRKTLELYYDLGANKEKYCRYYQQGKLQEKLQDNYSETDIELAKEYLEEKGQALVKKRNNNK